MSQRRRSSSAEAQIPPQLADYRNWPPQASESAVPITDCGLRESAASGLIRQRCAHRDCKIIGQSDRQNVVGIKRKSVTAFAIVVIIITVVVIHSVVNDIDIFIIIFITSSLSSHLTRTPPRNCHTNINIYNYCHPRFLCHNAT